MSIGYEAKVLYWNGNNIVFHPIDKGQEMAEAKRYVILTNSNQVKLVCSSKEDAENQAKKYAESYPWNKYYVGEIYAFYQTREPVQRVELA